MAVSAILHIQKLKGFYGFLALVVSCCTAIYIFSPIISAIISLKSAFQS